MVRFPVEFAAISVAAEDEPRGREIHGRADNTEERAMDHVSIGGPNEQMLDVMFMAPGSGA